MKKTLKDLKDIENFFLESDIQVEKEKDIKKPKNIASKVKILEDEIKYLKNQIKVLESDLDKKNSNKGNKLTKNDTEEIASMFMDFSIDKLHDKKVQEKINYLEIENSKLKEENKKLGKYLKKTSSLAKEKSYKNISYDEILKKIRKKYSFLGENSKVSLATAEYLFLNETISAIDYSSSYINYVKAFEIELRRVLKKSNEKLTFGSLMEKLKENTIFKSFVDKIESEKVAKIRNIAVHNKPINKNECGKLRKILIEDAWMDRISYLVEESLKEKKDSIVDFETYILGVEGREYINKQTYIHYNTDGDMDILSKSPALKDFIKGTGKVIKRNAQYFILLD